MKKTWFLLGQLFLSGMLLIAGENPAPFLKQPLTIRAEEITYNQETAELLASGEVSIIQSTISVRADRMIVNLESGEAAAEGNARIIEKDNQIEGERINYNFATSTGIIFQARGNITGWHFSVPVLERQSTDRYSGQKSSLSNCDEPVPHWHFSSSNLNLELNKKIEIYNSLIYLGKVPVFYLPYYYRGLGSSRLNIIVYPGYNGVDGLIVRTNTSYQFSSQLQGNLLLDYFARRGLGRGTRWDYNQPDFQATFYGYQIEEMNTGLNRWTMRSLVWQQVSADYSLRLDLNRPSDLSVNNYYFLENWQRSVVSPYSEFSLTYQKKKIYWRMLTGEYYDYDYRQQDYIRTKYLLPSFQFRALGINLSRQFYLNYNALLEKSYYNDSGHRLGLNQDINFWRSIILSRTTTLTPTLGWQNDWQWLIDQSTSTNISRHFEKINLRETFSSNLYLDLTYNFRQRFKPGLLEVAASDDDYGIEENILAGQLNYFEILAGMNFRSYLGYDWRQFRSNPVTEKWTLWRNEINWQKNSLWFYWNNQTNLYHWHNQAWQFSGGIGQREKKYIGLSVFNQGDVSWGMNLSAGIWLDRFYIDWRTTKNFSVTESDWFNWPDNQFRIYWDMHCWQSRINIVQRPDYYDFKIELSLKMPGPEQKMKVNENFYPWE